MEAKRQELIPREHAVTGKSSWCIAACVAAPPLAVLPIPDGADHPAAGDIFEPGIGIEERDVSHVTAGVFLQFDTLAA